MHLFSCVAYVLCCLCVVLLMCCIAYVLCWVLGCWGVGNDRDSSAKTKTYGIAFYFILNKRGIYVCMYICVCMYFVYACAQLNAHYITLCLVCVCA